MSYEDHAATERAMELLKKWRAEQIIAGREVAVRLIQENGRTNSREVREYMEAHDMLDDRVKDHWLGSVFRCKELFAWTGMHVQPPLTDSNSKIHAQHLIKEWYLVGGPKPAYKEQFKMTEPESFHANGGDKIESFLTRHRPKDYNEMVGQQTAISNLRRALSNGVQAYVFHGGSGRGKTTLARIAAQKMRVDQVIEIDAATHNSVDDIRELIKPYDYKMTGSRAIILDEVQKLSSSAFTVLLKTIEDSPEGLYWLLLTTEYNKIPENIQTRCVPIYLEDVSVNDLFDYLDKVCEKEGWNTPAEVLNVCAGEAHGSPRRALTLLAVCSHLELRPQALKAINVADDDDTSELPYRMAKAIGTFTEWPDFMPLVDLIEKEKISVESVRRVVRTYATTKARKSKNDTVICEALRIMGVFSEPFNDLSDLVQALGDIVYGGKRG